MRAAPPARLRILLVCGSFQLGGSERNVVQIATGLDRELFAVTVLGLSGAGPLRAALDARRIPVLVAGWSFDSRRLRADLDRLRHEMERAAPDIVHLFNYPAIYFGVAAGVEVGVPIRIVAIQAHDTWKGWTERITDRLVRPAVTLYLADGEGARRFAIRHQGLDPARVRLLYDGANLEELVPSSSTAALREHLGLREDQQVVGVIARLQDAHKGQSVFLRSIARLPAELPAQFILVGGGEDEAALRRLAADLDLGDRVIFAGPRAQLADVLHALDILVIPSLRYESVPKILLEGMAVGRPVVASRVGDIPEFVEDGVTGLLVEPGGPAALAAAMRRLLEHPDEAKALGDRARAALLSRGITRRQSLAALADVYRSLTIPPPEPPGPLLRARMRRAMTVYRLLRQGEERVWWLKSKRPWRRA